MSKESEWMPIEEPPDDNELILLYVNGPGVRGCTIGWRHPDGAYNNIRGPVSATHWMPLPVPPNDPKKTDRLTRLERRVTLLEHMVHEQ